MEPDAALRNLAGYGFEDLDHHEAMSMQTDIASVVKDVIALQAALAGKTKENFRLLAIVRYEFGCDACIKRKTCEKMQDSREACGEIELIPREEYEERR